MRIRNSFIPARGVGPKTERRLWAAGVAHWEDFDGSVVGETTADRIAAFIETGRDRLAAGDARFFADALPARSHWRLYEDFRESACFFDVETTGLSRRDEVTVVTLRRDGETRTLVRGRGLTRAALADAFADADLLVSFNGKSFDRPFLERSFDLDLDHPHLDLRYPCRRLDLTGGLAAVERALGIGRVRTDLSGADAVRLWREYEGGNEEALETLVAYNREDAENLVGVAEAICERLHRTVFADASPDGEA